MTDNKVKVHINIPANSEAEAATMRLQLQGLVDVLGYDRTKGLLSNYKDILSNTFVKMKLDSYAKK